MISTRAVVRPQQPVLGKAVRKQTCTRTCICARVCRIATEPHASISSLVSNISSTAYLYLTVAGEFVADSAVDVMLLCSPVRYNTTPPVPHPHAVCGARAERKRGTALVQSTDRRRCGVAAFRLKCQNSSTRQRAKSQY